MEKTEAPNLPMPSAGGSYIRDADGNLRPNPEHEVTEGQAEPAAAEPIAAESAPEAAGTPADEPSAEAPARRNTRTKE